MASDRELVKQVQQHLRNWNPDGHCEAHGLRLPGTEYDEQGHLSRLHLCQLSLTQVPWEVWQFSSLQTLSLSNNQLSSLPVQIGNLSALQTLALHHNQLSSLPIEVGNLSALQTLYLYHNQLSSLPVQVGNLSALQTLYLYHNQLSSLPIEVGNLSALQTLYLSNNQLSFLPIEVGNLPALQTLYLSNNQLSSLPIEVGNLSTLRWLSLENNQLSSLPIEVGNLSALQTLRLDNNPLQAPLAEIISQGVPAILAYLRTLQPVKIFYCYAHEDKELRDRIDKHLGVLKRLGQVVGWYDREIQAGTEWKREIEGQLRAANIILLLVSADFVDSDYCYSVEMKKALELHRAGRACVLPILLRPVDWQDAPFATLQMLPTGAKPITQWKDQDEALENVAKGIRNVVSSLRAQKR